MLATYFRPDFPFSPKRLPFFYGWIIAVVTTIGTLASIPGQTAGVSVFTDHLIEATALSRTQLSSAYLVGTLTSGLLLPFGGRFLDRVGARLGVVLSSVGLGVTLVYLSASDRFLEGLASRFPQLERSLLAFLVLTLGFVSLRFCGQGMLTLVSRNTLGKWFDRRRGLVSGIAGVFISCGFSAAPLLLIVWVNGLGWRGAWLALGLLVGLGMGSLGWLSYRDNPEECGLLMDGIWEERDRATTSETAVVANLEKSATAKEAIATIGFWALTLTLACQALSVTGITFHIVDLGSTAGLSEAEAVGLFLPMAIVSTVVGLLVGLFSDRVGLRWLIIAMAVSLLVGLAAIAHLEVFIGYLGAIVGLGISGGYFGILTTIALPRLFGRAHLGAIGGIQMTCLVAASAIGPTLLAFFREEFGSYRWGLYACCLMLPVAVVLALLIRGEE